MKVIHIEDWVQTKEWWNTKLESIVPYSLGDGVRPVAESGKVSTGAEQRRFFNSLNAFY